MSEPSIGYVLWDVMRLVRKQYQAESGPNCLTIAQAKALFHISLHEGIRQVELAELLEIKPMSLVRVIDSLMAEELVERRPDPKDRRAHQIFLLPAAHERLVHIKSASDRIWAEALRGLTVDERAHFVTMLERIHSNLAK